MNLYSIAKWLGWIVMAGFMALLIAELFRFFATAFSANAPARREGRAMSWRRLAVEVLAAFVASRLLILLTLAICYWLEHRGFDGFSNKLYSMVVRWDARHYLAIMRDGYVTTGDDRLRLVFLPFYPLLCRGVWRLTGLSELASAMVVSNLALLGSGAAVYRLTLTDAEAPVARRAMLLLMFCPVTFFYSLVYTESTFLLVTLLAVLCARRKRWAPAVCFAALSVSTRVLGMATAIPIFWEMLRDIRDRRAAQGQPAKGWALAGDIAQCAIRVLPVSAGLLAYMLINYRLFGNPLQFLVFQRENWHQTFGSLAKTFHYSLNNALDYDRILYQLGVWGPQALLLPGIPLLVALRRRRECPGDVGYALVYHYVSYAPTWLLSGARYSSAMYTLYPMLARIPKSRRGFVALMAADIVLLLYMVVVGMWYGFVL